MAANIGSNPATLTTPRCVQFIAMIHSVLVGVASGGGTYSKQYPGHIAQGIGRGSIAPGGGTNMTGDRIGRPDRTGPYRAQFEANKKIILASQSICAICGRPVDKSIKSPDPLSPSVDHIVPIVKGGHPSDINNLQLTHRACNRAKGTKLVPDQPVEKVNMNRMLPHSRNWMRD